MKAPRRRRVVQDYWPQYPSPIAAAAGQQVTVVRVDDEYPGWVWCIAPDSREGWVPIALLERHDAVGVLTDDYDATELAVQTGDEVDLIEELERWARVRNRAGQAGWIPERCLSGT